MESDQSRALLKTVRNIAQRWELTQDQEAALLGAERNAVEDWWNAALPVILPASTVERIACVLNIYSQLQVLLPTPGLADAWVLLPNSAPLFGGGTALQQMMEVHNDGLIRVSAYLDAQAKST